MNVNLHVDCDPLWVYASEYGSSPDYRNALTWEESLPALLEELRVRGLRATFFVIGRDLELPACRAFCRRVIEGGHQLANHSYSHPKDMHRATPSDRRSEIVDCHNAIRQALNFECRGIRLPGYYFDDEIVSILAELGYLYDSSVLPGPGVHMMALAYRLLNRRERHKQFGRFWFLFSPASPYRLKDAADGSCCWEMPVGTAPVIRLPIHTNFVFQWGMRYLEWALGRCRTRRSHLVYLFHAIDLLDGGKTGALQQAVATFKRPASERQAIVRSILDRLARENVITTEEMLGATASSALQ